MVVTGISIAEMEDASGVRADVGLVALVEAARQEVRLTPTGWHMLRADVLRSAASPSARERHGTVHRPLLVSGLPRSGTTLLHGLLVVATGRSYVPHWRAVFGPDADETARVDAAARLATFRRLAPDVHGLHPMAVDGPEECTVLLQHLLRSHQFAVQFGLPEYLDWLEAQPPEPVAEGLWRLLGALDEDALVLKSPFHGVLLHALRSSQPDLTVVWVRRPRADVRRSWAQLIAAVQAPAFRGKAPDRSLRWEVTFDRMEAGREDLGDVDWIVDVDYEDLVARPLGVLEEVLERSGEQLSAERAARVGRWLDAHPAGGWPEDWSDG